MNFGWTLRWAAPALCALCLSGCLGPVPVDIVLADNEIYFVLEEPREIRAVFVAVNEPGTAGKELKPEWALRHNLTSSVKTRKYPRLSQFRYGQDFAEFPVVTGPAGLRRNVEYVVGIDMGRKFAREIFILTDDGKVVMPSPTFERQKDRSYLLSMDKNGKKTLVPVKK